MTVASDMPRLTAISTAADIDEAFRHIDAGSAEGRAVLAEAATVPFSELAMALFAERLFAVAGQAEDGAALLVEFIHRHGFFAAKAAARLSYLWHESVENPQSVVDAVFEVWNRFPLNHGFRRALGDEIASGELPSTLSLVRKFTLVAEFPEHSEYLLSGLVGGDWTFGADETEELFRHAKTNRKLRELLVRNARMTADQWTQIISQPWFSVSAATKNPYIPEEVKQTLALLRFTKAR